MFVAGIAQRCPSARERSSGMPLVAHLRIADGPDKTLTSQNGTFGPSTSELRVIRVDPQANGWGIVMVDD